MRSPVAPPLLIGAGIIVVVIGVVFFAANITESPLGKKVPSASKEIPAVTVRDTYSKGKHTISGTIAVKNQCQSATVTAAPVVGGLIRVDIQLPDDTGSCLQLATVKSFILTAQAPATAAVAIYVNGALATTTAK